MRLELCFGLPKDPLSLRLLEVDVPMVPVLIDGVNFDTINQHSVLVFKNHEAAEAAKQACVTAGVLCRWVLTWTVEGISF
jgi:hypothetical protein